MENEFDRRYLSLTGSIICIAIIVLCVIILRQIAPFLYENAFTYSLITILLFGGVSWTVIRVKELDPQYLFPRFEYEGSTAPFLLMTISFFLLARVGLDIEELLILGSQKFLETRGELIYSLSSRKGVHFITIVIVAPIMEEILFRGLFLRSFFKRYSVRTSVIFSSLLFAILHIGSGNYVAMLVITFLSGIFYAWLVLKTKNIKIAIGCHIFWNFLNYLLPMVVITLNGRVESLGDFTILLLTMMITAAILVYVSYRLLRKQSYFDFHL